jgi:hypothetical protein
VSREAEGRRASFSREEEVVKVMEKIKVIEEIILDLRE